MQDIKNKAVKTAAGGRKSDEKSQMQKFDKVEKEAEALRGKSKRFPTILAVQGMGEFNAESFGCYGRHLYCIEIGGSAKRILGVYENAETAAEVTTMICKNMGRRVEIPLK